MDAAQIVAAAEEAGIASADAAALVSFALGFAQGAKPSNGAAAPPPVPSKPGFSEGELVGKVGTTQLPGGGSWKRKRVRIKELLAGGLSMVGKEVKVGGWVKTLRKQTPTFVQLNDGSTGTDLQVIMADADAGHDMDWSTENFAAAVDCGGTGACMTITGVVVKSPAEGQLIEVQARSVEVHGTVSDPKKYPLSKKRHTVETLRQIMHLRPRTNLIGAVTRVRNACAYATHRFFQDRGFLYINTPLITGADCEGAGEMFQVTTILPEDGDLKKVPLVEEIKPSKKKPNPVQPKNLGCIDHGKDFFKKPSFLTVSGQLNVECFSCSMSDVYTFGPTFRAEDSHTSRHLAEFWMIEPEIAFADLNDNMRLAEDYLKYCTQFVLDNCADDLAFFDQRVEKGIVERLNNVVQNDFQRMTYTEAIDLLLAHKREKKVKFNRKAEKADPLRWGIDLRSEHERYLSEVVYKKPVIITDYPASFKAFYMRMNENCEEGKETVRAMDILVPKIGEIIGGAQREERIDQLKIRIEAQGQTLEDFSWYTDLRKYGTVPHAGFGLGFERLVQFVSGVENIRDVIPFPRWPGNASF